MKMILAMPSTVMTSAPTAAAQSVVQVQRRSSIEDRDAQFAMAGAVAAPVASSVAK